MARSFLKGSLLPPLADVSMVAAHQGLRDLPAWNSSGRVYCGQSSRPGSEKDSLTDDSRFPSTPSCKRATESITMAAGSSPPLRTKSPMEISSSARCSATRSSTPSHSVRRSAAVRRAPRTRAPQPDRTCDPGRTAARPFEWGRVPKDLLDGFKNRLALQQHPFPPPNTRSSTVR